VEWNSLLRKIIELRIGLYEVTPIKNRLTRGNIDEGGSSHMAFICGADSQTLG